LKIALITDQHFGCRNDSQIFLDYQQNFYETIFFPYLDKHDIDTVWDLGDTFDRRKYLNYATLKRVNDFWFSQIRKRKIRLVALVGNHTSYHTNTLEVNALKELYSNQRDLVVVHKPYEEYHYPCGVVLFLPWICAENEQECMKAMAETEAKICFGHFQIKGFEQNAGIVCDSGLDSSYFGRFTAVFSGHFHKKSSKDNITYLGTPYEITWSDFGTTHGFHIFDTETLALEYIENPNRMFHKLVYDDNGKDLTEVMDWNFSQFQNTYVKVLVKAKTNPYWFDMFVDELEKYAVDVKIVEDVLEAKTQNDIVADCENTVSILKKFVAEANLNVDKERLDTFLVKLYEEALTLES